MSACAPAGTGYGACAAGPIVRTVRSLRAPGSIAGAAIVAVAALVLVLEAAAPAVHAGAQAGTVAGTVRLVTATSKRLATPGAYPTRRVGTPSTRELPELPNVVVYVRRPPGRAPVAAGVRHVMRQTDEEFVPHVLAVGTGAIVDFPNDDLVFHNVFSLSSAATFDLGRYPQHASKAHTFRQPGIVKIYCHLHSHMSAIVRVFDHPFFTTVGADGRFTLPGLDPGRHEVVAWHERVGDAVASVEVTSGQTSDVHFSLPLKEAR